MKKFILVFSIALAALQIIFTAGVAGDRMILIEFFTSSTCGPCASNNPTMTAFVNAQNPERLSAIGFHMNWPSPGNDPMYLYNQSDNNTRRTYYGINSIPEARFDGLINVYPSYNQAVLQSYYDSRTNILSPVTIIVRDSVYSTDSVTLKVFVYCETSLANPTVTIHIALMEDLVSYQSPPGTNGEKDFHWVMRKMYPSGTGTTVTMAPGSRYYIEQKFKKDPLWVWNRVSYVAYVQDNITKEILNAAKKLTNFSMLPYPAFKSVPQGTAGSGNYKIHIPYVAQGYNSPITLTAAVEPVTSGISVSFPGGNIINNYPDSISMQVTSTSAVPTGTYKIVVTGTNAASKVHKTTVDYLVGKNFITTKTNPPNLNYKVDGTLYSSVKIFDWTIGTQHTLQAITPQIVDATKFVFFNWSNGGDTSQTITTSATVSEYTANYKSQFRLMMLKSPAGLPVTLTPGNNLFLDSNSTINGGVSPVQVSYNGKTYYFNRWVGSGNGSYNGTNSNFQISLLSPVTEIAVYDTIDIGIRKFGDLIPTEYKVYQNYPNPFNPFTKIKFDLPSLINSNQNAVVKLEIFDVTGRLINTLVNERLSPGTYEVGWDASQFSSGIYFYKITAGSYVDSRRMLLIK